MATKLASGYIELTVKSNVKKDVSGQLSDVEKQAKKTGDAIDKNLGRGAERATKSAKDLNKELDSAKGKAKDTGDELEKSVTRGAKNAGKSVDKEIGDAGKRASKSIGEDILDGALKASKDGGKALSDALVNAAGEGGKAIGKAIGDTAVGDWLRDIQAKAEPVLDITHKIGDAFYAFKDKDIAGGLSSVADGLTKIGQSDAAKTVQDLADKAQPLQDTFLDLKGSISGTTEGLMTLAGNSGKIAGGLAAISAAAGPLAATFAMLQAIPGWSDHAGGVIDQITGKKDFNAKDWFNTLMPGGTYVMDQAFGPVVNGPDPTKGFQSPIPAKPGVSAIPLPGSAPAVEPGYQAATGSMDPFSALGSPGAPKAAPSSVTTPVGGGTKGAVFNAMVGAGFPASEFGAVDSIVSRESSWNPGATNPKSGAYGLFQFLGHQGDKYGAMGGYSADPAQQANAGMAYIKDRYGSPSNAKAFWDAHGWYDDGGLLQPGITIAHNETGKPELVLTQDQLQGAQAPPQGIDMGALLGQGQGQGQGNDAMQGLFGAPGGKDLRTQGYIPAGAGGKGTAGTSFASGALQMGAQAINGLIDQAASAAATAISAAATAGSFGAGGQAAGPASSFLIGIGTQAAKRGVQYGFQMAGIAADAIPEILMPFGVPRFFQTDPTQFIPQLPGQAAAVTTGEKAQQQQDNPAAANQPGMNPAGPVQPGQLPGQQPIGSPAQIASPGTGDFTPAAVGTPALAGPNQGGQPAPDINAGPMPKGPAPAIAAPTPPKPAPQPQKPPTPLDFVPMDMPDVFDNGGWLMPGQMGINKSNAPEPMAVFTPEQWGTLGNLAKGTNMTPNPHYGGTYAPDYSTRIDNVTVKDVNELISEANSRSRLAMMRHAGRP